MKHMDHKKVSKSVAVNKSKLHLDEKCKVCGHIGYVHGATACFGVWTRNDTKRCGCTKFYPPDYIRSRGLRRLPNNAKGIAKLLQ